MVNFLIKVAIVVKYSILLHVQVDVIPHVNVILNVSLLVIVRFLSTSSWDEPWKIYLFSVI